VFGVGSSEMVLLLLIAFLLFGPDRLPEMARTFGKLMNRWRDAVSDVKREILAEKPPEKKDGEP
jgi:Tat protein translocase TatB subunit